MDREEELGMMAQGVLCFAKGIRCADCVKKGKPCDVYVIMARMYDRGYRFADEVRKETEKRIYQRLYDLCTKDNPFGAHDLLKEDVLGWAKEDGVEIEECKTVDFEDIEQSDVIELPCKIQIPHVKGVDVFMYQVLWRSNDGSGFVFQRFFNTEPEADAFLEELKNKAKEKSDGELAELYDVTDTFNRLAGKKRAGGKLTDAEVDKMLAAYERMCEIEKKRGMRK